MPRSHSYREKIIKELFNYEESNNIPKEQRLTFDPYADVDTIEEASPRKKAYVDIRDVEGKLSYLKHNGKL